MKLTAERLREQLYYDPERGLFTWNVRRPGVKYGGIAGCLDAKEGYRLIGLNNRLYRANRLAWLYMTGKWPDHLIDHINGNPSDDRFINLRQATQSQNHVNSRMADHNTSGLKGVTFYKRYGKWRASIQKDRKHIHIGYFDTAQEAHDARTLKARELFGQFARAA